MEGWRGGGGMLSRRPEATAAEPDFPGRLAFSWKDGARPRKKTSEISVLTGMPILFIRDFDSQGIRCLRAWSRSLGLL